MVREVLAEQYGVKSEEVTWKQIQFEVSGLLSDYPAIKLIPSTPILEPPPSAKPTGIGVEIRRLLDEARLRPEDIAEEIGIGPRNVYRHLAGDTVPSLVNVGKYEKALSKHLRRSVRLSTSAKRQ